MYIIFLISLFYLLSTPLSYIGGGSNIVYLDEKAYKKFKKTITFINITIFICIGILTSIYYFNEIDSYILIGTFFIVIQIFIEALILFRANYKGKKIRESVLYSIIELWMEEYEYNDKAILFKDIIEQFRNIREKELEKQYNKYISNKICK